MTRSIFSFQILKQRTPQVFPNSHWKAISSNSLVLQNAEVYLIVFKT